MSDEIHRRVFHLEALRAVDDGQETFEASLASSDPIPRSFGLEVLDHAEGAIDLSRARNGLPLLRDHDPSEARDEVDV